MYMILSLLLIAVALSIGLGCAKRRVLRQLSKMSVCSKIAMLNDCLMPFGYCFSPCCDGVSSTCNAWQRNFGYARIYDQSAVFFQMIFDSQPIYFDYCDKTWLFEVWKGQYGMNTGAEIGLYHAFSIVDPDCYEDTLFFSACDNELLPVSFTLFRCGQPLCKTDTCHWWSTIFFPGCYSKPEELSLEICVTFPDCAMLSAFLNGMIDAGYSPCDLYVQDCSVKWSFDVPKSIQPYRSHPLICRLAMCWNFLLSRLFLWVTRPLLTMLDRLCFLFLFARPLFGWLICRNHACCCPKRRRGRRR
ncbi:MAG: DUF4474 domain-containing protein [Lachnospiraceae bacterium]